MAGVLHWAPRYSIGHLKWWPLKPIFLAVLQLRLLPICVRFSVLWGILHGKWILGRKARAIFISFTKLWKAVGKKKKLAFHVLLISAFQLTVRNFAAVNTLEALQCCSMRQDTMDHYSVQQTFNLEQCANHLLYATNSLKTLNFSKKASRPTRARWKHWRWRAHITWCGVKELPGGHPGESNNSCITLGQERVMVQAI